MIILYCKNYKNKSRCPGCLSDLVIGRRLIGLETVRDGAVQNHIDTFEIIQYFWN
jgi:hypothetical protein